MLLFSQTLGVLFVIYIQYFLPLGCKAGLESEEIRMQYVEEAHGNFYMKPSRKLLDEGNNQIIQMNYTHLTSDRPWFWFCLAIILIIFFLILVRCCFKLAKEEYDEHGRTVHPPPEIQTSIRQYANSRSLIRTYGNSTPSVLSYGSSRPLAPPRTSSRSLILLPEPGTDESVYFAIENPNINLFNIYHDTSDQINHQLRIPISNDPPLNNLPNTPSPSISPRQLHDLPPDYNSIVTANQQKDKSTCATNIPKDFENAEKTPPPKYEDLH